jgi:hypothetical protein
MKRTGIVTVVLGVAMCVAICAAMCVAQAPPQKGVAEGSHEDVSRSRTTFGSECGMRDTSPQRALRFTRSSDGKWIVLSANKRPGSGDTMAARVWHEAKWMVDIHDTLGTASPVTHSGQMCFDRQGRITLMIDRYMELAQCRCMRYTSLAFDADGKVMRREQAFVDEMTGAPMDAPAAAKGFPDVWEFRRVEQLPFYSLLKK